MAVFFRCSPAEDKLKPLRGEPLRRELSEYVNTHSNKQMRGNDCLLFGVLYGSVPSMKYFFVVLKSTN